MVYSTINCCEGYFGTREQFLKLKREKKQNPLQTASNTTRHKVVECSGITWKRAVVGSEMVLLFNNLQFSRWTFFKHLTPRKYTTLCQNNSTSNLSHFLTLTSRQKDQIHLYVDTLLQWNKVFYLFTFLFSHTTTTITLILCNCICSAWI